MPDFDPDAYLAKKLGGFDPDAYLASKKPKKPAAPLQDLTADAPPKPNVMSMLNRIPGSKIITGPVEAGANMLSGAVAKPVSEVMGLAAQAKDYISGKPGDAEGFQRSIREGMTYQPRTAAGLAVAEYNPLALIGKGVDYLGGLAEAKPDASLGRRMLGAGVHELVNQAPQLALMGAPPAMRAAGEAMTGEGVGAKRWMRSALKPTVEANNSGAAAKAVDTLLEKGINVSPGGVQKMQSRIAELNNQIAGIVENHPGIVDKADVSVNLQGLLGKFADQVNPKADLSAIQKAFLEFEETAPDKMTLPQAQRMKQGTYKQLGDKAYNSELKAADIAAQKELARGLKDSIAKQAPEVVPLNTEESALLNAMNVSERRVLMEANKNPMGLSLLASEPTKMLAFLADRSGLFKSLVARMLNTSGQALIRWSDSANSVLNSPLEGKPGMKLAPLGANIPNQPRVTGRPMKPGASDIADLMTTSAGAAAPRQSGMSATGLYKSLGEEPPLPQGIPKPPGSEIPLAQSEPLGGMSPDWTTSAGAAAAESPIQVIPGHSLYDQMQRTKTKPSQPQMPSMEFNPTPITDELGFIARTEAEQEALRHPAVKLARDKMLKDRNKK